MERLTKRIDGSAHGAEGVSRDKLTGTYCRGKFEATACVEKLAEYEDLEDKLNQQFNSCISMGEIIDSFIEYYKQSSEDEQIADALLITNDSARKYHKWEKLEEQGLLLKLPCKVGDTAYRIDRNNKKLRKCAVEAIYYGAYGTDNKWHIKIDSFHYNFSDISKTVFLTQDEAGEALKRMEAEKT